MSWYRDCCFPYLMNKNIGKAPILKLRKEMLQYAYGNILEIGIGTGANLPFYPAAVKKITAVDCYVRQLPDSAIEIDLVRESAQEMHFADGTFDTVVSTFSLCSVKELDKVLAEICRVLKPGGQLIFLEHGRGKNKLRGAIQDLCSPIYEVTAYGCHINRNYMPYIKAAGLNIRQCRIVPAPIYPSLLTGIAYMGIAEKPNQEEAHEKDHLSNRAQQE